MDGCVCSENVAKLNFVRTKVTNDIFPQIELKVSSFCLILSHEPVLLFVGMVDGCWDVVYTIGNQHKFPFINTGRGFGVTICQYHLVGGMVII